MCLRQYRVHAMYLSVLWFSAHLYVCWHAVLGQGVDHEPVLAICPGRCIALEGECNTTIDGTHCGLDAKCCLDSMEGVTEMGFDFSTISSSEWKDTANEEDGITTDTSNLELEELVDSAANIEDFFLDSAPRFSAVDSLVSCPGACIPLIHVGLCQVIITIDGLCSPDKRCCATKESVKKIQRDYLISDDLIKHNFNSLNQCPGKCIHPSLTVFCDKVLSSHYCPGESKCCNKELIAANAEPIQCTGHCIPKQSTYFCHPPLKLVPEAINCKESMVCCMEVKEIEVETAEVSEETELSELAADGTGQLYIADENGEYKALSMITSEESLSSDFAYVTDVDTELGLVSVYRDSFGNLYQLSNIGEGDIQPEVTVTGSSEPDVVPEESIVSMPDDSDDMEENMQDVALVEEGERIFPRDQIPPGERTMIRPQCPGTCISSFLKFTCTRSSAPYDGFSCPGKLVCCANLVDIEEHEEYLKSLSPYFRAAASVSHQHPECGITGYNGSPSDKRIPIEKWCWQAAVINEQNQYVCGAAIIDNSWILTPAHCVTGALRQDQSIYIRAGVSDLTSSADNAESQTRKAQSIYVHPSHNSMSLDNDIALIKLSIPFELNRNVCVVCLPVSEATEEMCTVTGYGFLSRVGTLSLRLHEALVPVIDDIDCIANVTDALASVFILPASSFCAGGNAESCQGDAGGLLVCDNDGVYELSGMVSWSLGCKHDYVPSIYVKISTFMDWINQIISASTFLKALR